MTVLTDTLHSEHAERVDALRAEQRETVRRRVTETLNGRGVRTMRTDVVHAVARR